MPIPIHGGKNLLGKDRPAKKIHLTNGVQQAGVMLILNRKKTRTSEGEGRDTHNKKRKGKTVYQGSWGGDFEKRVRDEGFLKGKKKNFSMDTGQCQRG